MSELASSLLILFMAAHHRRLSTGLIELLLVGHLLLLDLPLVHGLGLLHAVLQRGCRLGQVYRRHELAHLRTLNVKTVVEDTGRGNVFYLIDPVAACGQRSLGHDVIVNDRDDAFADMGEDGLVGR